MATPSAQRTHDIITATSASSSLPIVHVPLPESILTATLPRPRHSSGRGQLRPSPGLGSRQKGRSHHPPRPFPGRRIAHQRTPSSPLENEGYRPAPTCEGHGRYQRGIGRRHLHHPCRAGSVHPNVFRGDQARHSPQCTGFERQQGHRNEFPRFHGGYIKRMPRRRSILCLLERTVVRARNMRGSGHGGGDRLRGFDVGR